MPMWQEVPHRRDGIEESIELPGTTQQALVERTDVGVIVSISLLLPAGKTTDDGKAVAERMLMEARRKA